MYILDINPLSHICYANIFSHFVDCFLFCWFFSSVFVSWHSIVRKKSSLPPCLFKLMGSYFVKWIITWCYLLIHFEGQIISICPKSLFLGSSDVSSILVRSGQENKITQTGWLKQQKSRVKVQANLVPGESFLLGLQMATFPLYCHMAKRISGVSSSYRSTSLNGLGAHLHDLI